MIGATEPSGGAVCGPGRVRNKRDGLSSMRSPHGSKLVRINYFGTGRTEAVGIFRLEINSNRRLTGLYFELSFEKEAQPGLLTHSLIPRRGDPWNLSPAQSPAKAGSL